MAKHSNTNQTPSGTGARAGSVTTRVWPLYYPHDYEKAKVGWVSFEMREMNYDEYLDTLASAIEEDIAKYGSVLVAPMFVEEFEVWAARMGLSADNSASRRKYLRTYPPGGMYAVEDVTGVFTMLRADSMRVLRSTTISSQREGLSLEEFRSEISASERLAEEVYATLSGDLSSRMQGLAAVAYEAHGVLNGTDIPLEGGLALSVEGHQLAVESAAHEDLLRALILLGTVAKTNLKVRGKVGEEEKAWEWVITPEGISEFDPEGA